MKELKPIYDNRKSFYGKAKVSDDGLALFSYMSNVCEIVDGKPRLLYYKPSNTTLRHIKEFLKQHSFKADSLKQLRNDYYKED